MTTTITSADHVHSIIGLTASEASDSLKLSTASSALGCVSVIDGGGSGFNGGTVTIQVSLDGTSWFTLTDVGGVNITFTADGYAEFSTAAYYIRASADASVSDVDVSFVLKR